MSTGKRILLILTVMALVIPAFGQVVIPVVSGGGTFFSRGANALFGEVGSTVVALLSLCGIIVLIGMLVRDHHGSGMGSIIKYLFVAGGVLGLSSLLVWVKGWAG